MEVYEFRYTSLNLSVLIDMKMSYPNFRLKNSQRYLRKEAAL